MQANELIAVIADELHDLEFELGLDAIVVETPTLTLRLRTYETQIDASQPSLQSSIFPVRELKRRIRMHAVVLVAESLDGPRTDFARMAALAEDRGDIAGADAWRVVIEALDTAKRAAEKAGQQQTWDVEVTE